MSGRMKLRRITWTLQDVAAMLRCAQWLRDEGITERPVEPGVWEVVR